MLDAMSRPRRPTSVRVRILAAVMLTTTIGMVGAGMTSYLLARQATYESIDRALGQENEEIKTVAAVAQEGRAARPIRRPSDLLYLAIKSSVPGTNEAILGLVNGRVALVPTGGDPLQSTLPDDAELVAAAAAAQPAVTAQVHRIQTRQHGELAYVSIPIRVTGSPDRGHYVAVFDVDAAFVPVNRTHFTYALLCLLALLLVGLVGYSVSGRLLAPLRSLQRTAQRINETDLTDRIPQDQLASNDEVAALGRTMNAMLDRLATSFDTQRRSLDDAGHELRTPITIVRGHLELVDVDDPVDVGRTRDVAISELDRMQRMVEEITLLAKAGRPDFVRPEPVVVSDLLDGVLEKVTPLASRSWRIDALPDGGSFFVDPQRITQALVQLVVNAIRFTDPGAVIALGARQNPYEVRIWVRDEGTGIAEPDQARIFDRFRRGDQAQPRDGQPDVGAGLGLAIVSAIADAHRGRVELDSRPGRGSRFTLVLPQRDRVSSSGQTGAPVGTPAVSEREAELSWPRS
jgi:two-component system, OmpR family, sensor kinase